LAQGQGIIMQGKLTSIIILTYNQLEYTKFCIESIREKTEKDTYEIIVVDNGSTDDTVFWLEGQTDVICINNKENKGFPSGCNQGIAAAKGTEILLLNNDTIVTDRWIDNLKTALYSDEKIGAVGPVTNNCSAYQSIEVPYTNIQDMQSFATQYNQADSQKWEKRIGLVGFCMLIKRAVVEQVGLLDELFSPGNFEDDDYSLRIIAAGYSLLLCHDTFIHHFGSVSFKERPEAYLQLLEANRNKFSDKWGFSPKSTNILIGEMKNMVDRDVARVLEIGCGCGATLLRFKWDNPTADLYGVPLSQNEAAIAEKFFDVSVKDIVAIEDVQLNYQKKSFDVIILNDIFNKLNNPKQFLIKIKTLLKANGRLLISIANMNHIKTFRNLINDHWQYAEDSEYIRHFTLTDIRKIFADAGIGIEQITGMTGSLSKEDVQLIEAMKSLNLWKNIDVLEYESYLLKGSYLKASEDTKKNTLKLLLRRVEYNIEREKTIKHLLQEIEAGEYEIGEIVEIIHTKIWNKTQVTIMLAKELYAQGLINEALHLMIKVYAFWPADPDFVYSLAYMLDLAGEKDAALKVLANFKGEANQNINELILAIQKK
jgi:GT2 family glycosyltransferase